MSRAREWLRWHSLYHHLTAPLWRRLPERRRWAVVHWLDRSRRRCWGSLVDAALCSAEDDPCDVRVPALRGEQPLRCATTCGWSHVEHTGPHTCACYCGKFMFRATEGARDRAGAA
jgi:hypothetical protein